jgi:DNA-binding beta-propeller fold protein YncE
MIYPNSVTVDGSQIWVTTAEGDPLIEFNANNGSITRVVLNTANQFLAPEDVAVSGSHVWVTNLESYNAGSNGSVTELNASNGSLVKIADAVAYGFKGPYGLVVNGANVWILNSGLTVNADKGPWSVTELSALNGSLVRNIKAPAYGFINSSALAVSNSKVWVANAGNNTVTELSATNGSLVKIIK